MLAVKWCISATVTETLIHYSSSHSFSYWSIVLISFTDWHSSVSVT